MGIDFNNGQRYSGNLYGGKEQREKYWSADGYFGRPCREVILILHILLGCLYQDGYSMTPNDKYQRDKVGDDWYWGFRALKHGEKIDKNCKKNEKGNMIIFDNDCREYYLALAHKYAVHLRAAEQCGRDDCECWVGDQGHPDPEERNKPIEVWLLERKMYMDKCKAEEAERDEKEYQSVLPKFVQAILGWTIKWVTGYEEDKKAKGMVQGILAWIIKWINDNEEDEDAERDEKEAEEDENN